MPSWKKVITSGSNAILAQISASVVPTATTQNLLAIDSSTGGIMQITQSGTGGINTFANTGIRTGDGFIGGHITASGNISASGTGSFGVIHTNKIYDPGDASGTPLDTFIDLRTSSNNNISIVAGGRKAVDFLFGKVLINKDLNDSDFKVGSANHERLLATDAAEEFVEVSGSLRVTGPNGNITASNIQVDNDIALGGNIFSFSGFSFIEGVSANFSGSNVFGSGSTPAANDISGGGTAHQFTGSVAITGSNLTVVDGNSFLDGDVTASGNISASNTIYTKFLRLPQAAGGGSGDGAIYFGSGVADNNGYIYDDNNSLQLGYNDSDILQIKPNDVRVASNAFKTTGNITASGNISASGHLFASLSLDSNNLNLVMYDTSSGKFFFTGSYVIADNLGNHTATQALDLASNNIEQVGQITANQYNVGVDIRDNVNGQTRIEFGNDLLDITFNAEADGNINMTPKTTRFYQPITSSHISSSGNITANSFIGNSLNEITQGVGLTLSGNVTASGNISASGNIIANSFIGNGSGITDVTASLPDGVYSSSLQTLGNITSSGNISASGIGIFERVEIHGALGSTNTLSISSSNGNVAINASSTDADCMVRLSDNTTAGTNVIGFVATGDDSIIRNDEGSFKVRMGNNSKTTLELNQAGGLFLSASGDITASGNISASGYGYFTNVGIGTDDLDQLVHIKGTNPQILLEESSTEFIRIGVEATTNDMCIGWDESDDLHLGCFNSTTDSSISTKMVISSSGHVGIGSGGVSNPDKLLTVKASVDDNTIARFQNTSGTHPQGIILRLDENSNDSFYINFQEGGGTNVGEIIGDGGGGISFSEASDSRLKNNIRDCEVTIDSLDEIKMRSYEKVSDRVHHGVVAQELLSSSFAHFVSTKENWNSTHNLSEGDEEYQYMSVAYSKFIPVLIKSVQDANKLIKAQQTTIDQLEARIQALES